MGAEVGLLLQEWMDVPLKIHSLKRHGASGRSRAQAGQSYGTASTHSSAGYGVVTQVTAGSWSTMTPTHCNCPQQKEFPTAPTRIAQDFVLNVYTGFLFT